MSPQRLRIPHQSNRDRAAPCFAHSGCLLPSTRSTRNSDLVAQRGDRQPQFRSRIGNHRILSFGNSRCKDAHANGAGSRAAQTRAMVVAAEMGVSRVGHAAHRVTLQRNNLRPAETGRRQEKTGGGLPRRSGSRYRYAAESVKKAKANRQRWREEAEARERQQQKDYFAHQEFLRKAEVIRKAAQALHESQQVRSPRRMSWELAPSARTGHGIPGHNAGTAGMVLGICEPHRSHVSSRNSRTGFQEDNLVIRPHNLRGKCACFSNGSRCARTLLIRPADRVFFFEVFSRKPSNVLDPWILS